jgi:hypothetical protein
MDVKLEVVVLPVADVDSVDGLQLVVDDIEAARTAQLVRPGGHDVAAEPRSAHRRDR